MKVHIPNGVNYIILEPISKNSVELRDFQLDWIANYDDAGKYSFISPLGLAAISRASTEATDKQST